METIKSSDAWHDPEQAVDERYHKDMVMRGICSPYLEVCSTANLCDELEKRNGVKMVYVEPYEKKTFEVEGPVCVFFVYC